MTKAGVGVMWSTVFAIPLAMALPAIAAELLNDDKAGIPADLSIAQAEFDRKSLRRDDMPNAALQTSKEVMRGIPPQEIETSNQIGTFDSGALRVPNVNNPLFSSTSDATAATHLQLAQLFELPRGTREGTGPSQRKARAAELPKELNFEYAYGSDSEFVYVRNPDLNSSVRDNSLLFAPTMFGMITYRPHSWMETRLELTLERIVALHEEKVIFLPNGDIQFAERKQWSLLIDQAYVKIKDVTDPFEITVGRRNFEDGRLWLYDAALDAVVAKFNHGNFQTEVSASRENWVDLDVFVRVPKGHTDNHIWYTEYRGIEDHKLAAYWIKRNDRKGLEGNSRFMGVRAYGRPSDEFNYWSELGFTRGEGELIQNKQKISGHGLDIGGTYRFNDLPGQASITLGYAWGSGDNNDTDNKDDNFRQTGLQSNETRFGGVTQFKRYGETFDPELSNLRIFTAGLGFRPAPTVWVDLVFHRYQLNEIANEFRSSGITAEMNKIDTRLSRDVGTEFDVILGFRNLFGVRRLGFEVRAGLFFPGEAYLRNDGDDINPVIRKADKSASILAVIIY